MSLTLFKRPGFIVRFIGVFSLMVFIAAGHAQDVATAAQEAGQHFQSDSDRHEQRMLLLSLIGLLALIAIVYLYLRKVRAPAIKKSRPE